MTFLAARSHPRPAAIVFGVPFDGTSTFRQGSAHAPAAIRWASQSIETYSPVLRRDLEDVLFSDEGDLEVTGMNAEEVTDAAEARVAGMSPGVVSLMLGGEHTVTLGGIRAMAKRHRDLAVVQLDAHTDLREEYAGRRLCHATVMKRVLDLVPADAVVATGVRAGTSEEFDLARTMRHSSPRLAITSTTWMWLQARPVYVTIDIDAIDPADAPGTGNPEPDGLAAADVLAFVRRLRDLRVVGFDLVEVSPPYDPSGRTAVLAALLIREMLLAIA